MSADSQISWKDPTAFFGRPVDPQTRSCEWCSAPAACAYEIFKPRKTVGTGQFLYSCRRHEQLAKEASRAPRRAA